MNDLLEYSRGPSWFREISGCIPEAKDYFDFPSSMIAFGESLSSSHLMTVDNEAFFRERNKQLTLISYTCPAKRLKAIVNMLIGGGQVIKSLNFVNKPFDGFQTQPYDKEYFLDGGWRDEYENLSSSRDRGKFRHAAKHYYVDFSFTIEEVMDVFNAWAEAAKARHFMVVKGHYIRYIERFFQRPNNVQIIGYRRVEDDSLWGIMGFEVWKEKGQVTLAKHYIGDNNFPIFFWLNSIKYIMSQGCVKLFCGSTADGLKTRLPLQSAKSYKLVLR